MINLFLTFLYTGFVAFGGGLATIPILYQTVVEQNLITEESFYNMVAISQATPGPIGLNLATFIGYNQHDIIGAIVASFAITISSLIFVSIFARIYDKIKTNKIVINAMGGIKATISGVIIVAVINIFKLVLLKLDGSIQINQIINFIKYINYEVLVVIGIFFFLIRKYKGSFIMYMLLGGIVGIFLF